MARQTGTEFFDLLGYPNPFTEATTLVINSSSSDDVLVRIFDISGQLMLTKTVKANVQFTIGEGLAAGIYFAEATQGNEKRHLKLVKTIDN